MSGDAARAQGSRTEEPPPKSHVATGSGPSRGGYRRTMSEALGEDRVAARAELLPEETSAGSEHPERTRRESTQTPDEPH